MISPRGATMRTRPPTSAPTPRSTSRAMLTLAKRVRGGFSRRAGISGVVCIEFSSLSLPVRGGHDRLGHQPVERIRLLENDGVSGVLVGDQFLVGRGQAVEPRVAK